MNRVILFGVAIFFAVAAIAMMGNENVAVAGHGCSGCDGGRSHCGGGLLERMRSRRCEGRHRRRCHAEPQCCDPAPCCEAGGEVIHEAAPVGDEPTPAAPAGDAPAAPAVDAAPAADAAAAPAEARFVAPVRVRFIRFRR